MQYCYTHAANMTESGVTFSGKGGVSSFFRVTEWGSESESPIFGLLTASDTYEHRL